MHHFDIPVRENNVRITAKAIVDVLERAFARTRRCGNLEDLDARVAQDDFWEMMLPSQYAASTE